MASRIPATRAGRHQGHRETADNQHSRWTVAGAPDRGPTGSGATDATAGRVRGESKTTSSAHRDNPAVRATKLRKVQSGLLGLFACGHHQPVTRQRPGTLGQVAVTPLEGGHSLDEPAWGSPSSPRAQGRWVIPTRRDDLIPAGGTRPARRGCIPRRETARTGARR
jgi:hypothetical protein